MCEPERTADLLVHCSVIMVQSSSKQAWIMIIAMPWLDYDTHFR